MIKVCCCLYNALIGLLEQLSENQLIVTDYNYGQYVAKLSLGLGLGICISDRASVIATSSPEQATPAFNTFY